MVQRTHKVPPTRAAAPASPPAAPSVGTVASITLRRTERLTVRETANVVKAVDRIAKGLGTTVEVTIRGEVSDPDKLSDSRAMSRDPNPSPGGDA